MIRTYYAIKDNLAEAFMTPVLFDNDNLAKRWFTGVVNSKEQNEVIYNNPEDFELWKLGDFDNQSGQIYPGIQKLVTAKSIKKGE